MSGVVNVWVVNIVQLIYQIFASDISSLYVFLIFDVNEIYFGAIRICNVTPTR